MSPALRRVLEEQHMRNPMFRFWYFVPHPDQDLRNATPFMAFTPGILLTAPLFARVLDWPIDIREPFSSREDVLRARSSGAIDLCLMPIEHTAFTAVVQGLSVPLRCVVTDDESCDWVDAQVAASQIPWMHISTVPGPGRVPFETATDDNFLAYAAQVGDALRAVGRDEDFRRWLEVTLAGKRTRTIRKVPCPNFEHNTTMPNLAAFRALRLTTSVVAPLRSDDSDRYVAAIVRSAEVVADQRRRMIDGAPWAKPLTDLTLSLDSVTWQMYRGEFDQAGEQGQVSRRDWRLFMKSARQRESFLHDINPRHVENEVFQAVYALRAQELRAFTIALALQNSFTLTPVVRIEPRINKVRGTLTQIGACARGNGPHREFKLRKMCRDLGTQMNAYVDTRFRQLLEGYRNRICGINVVSDLPLEWMSISGSRLGLRHDVSRLPVSPGSLLFGQCIKSKRLFVTPNDFKEILVIRSFLPADPLRHVLERALAVRSKEEEDAISFRIVDVATPEEFVEALREYSGAVMIFDGHGQRDKDTASGRIVIGGDPVDLWRFREQLNIPPIVLLSACDTLPIDGSHGSTAVGLLALGATTVLATLLPIHAANAALFLGRLAYRIEAFIPAALGRHPHGFDWRMMMAGMLRMVYVTEILHGLAAQGFLNEEHYKQIHYIGNVHINNRNPAWYEVVRQAILNRSVRSKPETMVAIEDIGSMTDALKYVQIGRPDLITVVRETAGQAIDRLDPQNRLGIQRIRPFNFEGVVMGRPQTAGEG